MGSRTSRPLRNAATIVILSALATIGLTAVPANASARTITDAPAVASQKYPSPGPTGGSGGGGIAGTFTFTANGAKDVTGYYYNVNGNTNTYVAANKEGGSAQIQYTPSNNDYGPNQLFVYSANAAGDESPTTDYTFQVANNAPTVTCTPEIVYIGHTAKCVITAYKGDKANTVGYVYSEIYNPNGETFPPTEITPDANGKATIFIYSTDGGDYGANLNVQDKFSDGNLSFEYFGGVYYDYGDTVVDQSATNTIFGAPVIFTFHSGLPGSVSFQYQWSDENSGEHTVPENPDGTATVALVPPDVGDNTLTVYSLLPSGIASNYDTADVSVVTNGPTITSSDYPEGQTSGQVGQLGTFTLTSPVPNVVSFTYTDGEFSATVPTNANGTATVPFTPTQTYETLTATSTFADGTTSQPSTPYDFFANSIAPTVTCPATVTVNQVFTCTLTPVQRNVVSYQYYVNSATMITAPANPDGTATLTLTAPGSPGSYYLLAQSVNSAGVASDSGQGYGTVSPSS